jgi:hypothetical protein
MSTMIAKPQGANLSVVVNEARGMAPRTRDPERVVQQVKAMVLKDPAVAVGCIYAVPIPSQDTAIRGPSVRLAEIIRYFWGGIWIEEIGVQEYRTHVEAKVMGVDVVTGNLTCAIAMSRIADDKGNPYSLTAVLNARMAALAKAKRNVILDLIPKNIVCDRIVNEIRGLLKKDRAQLTEKCKKVLEMLACQEKAPLGKVVESLEKRLGVKAKEPDSNEYSTDFMLTVIEYANALEDKFVEPGDDDAESGSDGNSQPDVPTGVSEDSVATDPLWAEPVQAQEQQTARQQTMKVRPLRRS